MKNWYLIQSKFNQEKIAEKNLVDQGYTVYSPHINVNNNSIALFPKYLFIQLDNKAQNWSPIRSTKGVANFVRFGLQFAKVPNFIISLIKAQESHPIKKIIDLSRFHKGDELNIDKGVFEGCRGIFERYEDDRVIALLRILNQSQELNFKQDTVTAI